MTFNRPLTAIAKLVFIAPLCLASAAQAQAAPNSPEAIVRRHSTDFAKGDRQALLDGYTDDTIMVRHGAVLKGKTELAAVIAHVDFAAQGALRIDHINVDGNVVIEDYTHNAGGPKETHGRDVFFLQGNKIAVQVVE